MPDVKPKRLSREEYMDAPKALRVEIRITCHADDRRRWEELWINDKWYVSYPNLIDGNQVAHSLALILRNEYGIDATYRLVPVQQENAPDA